MTCFNRREKTVACLRALQRSTGLEAFELHAVLVDDGSTDGTAERVAAEFPWVQIHKGTGQMFWCRGMHLAFDLADREDFDFYLWLNDDTMLMPDAIARLLRNEASLRARAGGAPVIVVGSTVDELTNRVTYTGEVRTTRWRPLHFRRLQPSEVPQRCDSMTGNIVLIGREAASKIGNLDPTFEHAMGDTDYALRAAASGLGVWIGEGIHGYCSDNPSTDTWRDNAASLAKRWRNMMSPKGLPVRSWKLITRRHAGPLWFAYFAYPYARVILQGLVASVLNAATRLVPSWRRTR